MNQQQQLPPGWISQFSPEHNRPFYVHPASGVRQWEVPIDNSARLPPVPPPTANGSAAAPPPYSMVDQSSSSSSSTATATAHNASINIKQPTLPPISNSASTQPVRPQFQNQMERFQQLVGRHEISPFMAVRLRQLETWDIVLLCDDSGSMRTPSLAGLSPQNPYAQTLTRWDELKSTVSTIVEIATCLDADGIDIHFLNREPLRAVTSTEQLSVIFSIPPSGYTPIARSLRIILNERRQKVLRTGESKKLLIVIATDGQPTDENGRIDKQSLYNILMFERPEDVNITFVACTDDDAEIGYLNEWDNRIPRLDVVDDYVSKHHIITCTFEKIH
ncbi:hypothetical protein HDV05_001804 [Chytridiales sp. JEL 0842]|nr:hypothetical protein HDV05_001804 [Chytridiales sp. JEL 0842]